MKTTLITGANKGIGFEVARELGQRGFKVFLTARDPEKGEKAAATLQKKGYNVTFLQMDVSDETSVAKAAKAFKEHADHLDVLVNNAGIYLDKGNILILKMETLLTTLTTNAFGPFLVTQHFLPFLKKGSRIINMASGMGSLSEMEDYGPAYSISKTMVNAITRQFAAALKDQGIAVNSVCPGWVQTDMGGKEAPRPVEKGAETLVWLATEAPITLTGKFLRDKKEIEW